MQITSQLPSQVKYVKPVPRTQPNLWDRSAASLDSSHIYTHIIYFYCDCQFLSVIETEQFVDRVLRVLKVVDGWATCDINHIYFSILCPLHHCTHLTIVLYICIDIHINICLCLPCWACLSISAYVHGDQHEHQHVFSCIIAHTCLLHNDMHNLPWRICICLQMFV